MVSVVNFEMKAKISIQMKDTFGFIQTITIHVNLIVLIKPFRKPILL